MPVVLTEQGEALLKTACQVVEQLQRVRNQISAEGGEPQNILRVATGRSLARTLVSDWVARLRKGRSPVLAPTMQVDISAGTMVDMSARLAQGKADRESGVEGKSGAVRVDLGVGRIIKKKK